jgi:hypothetical protein
MQNFQYRVLSGIFTPIIQNKNMYIGRWTIPNINNDDKHINKIIDRNNEDHCGICVNEQNISTSFENTKNKEEDDDKYYLPYIM